MANVRRPTAYVTRCPGITIAQVAYDPDAAKQLLEEAGWKQGSDGIREKDGVRAAFSVMYTPGDSVRQALAEDLQTS